MGFINRPEIKHRQYVNMGYSQFFQMVKARFFSFRRYGAGFGKSEKFSFVYDPRAFMC